MKNIRIHFCFLIASVLLTVFSTNVNAQGSYMGGVLAFGARYTATHNIKFGDILANKNNVLKCNESGYMVSGFSISFLPKGGDYLGPFKIVGNQLSEKILSGIEKIRAAHPQSMNVFFEDVTVMKGNQSLKGQPMILKCTE